jgi:DNA-binding response OmpR family regulator
MVLDDNDIAREVATKVLSKLNLNPISMGDSEKAMTFCKKTTPELLILDIMMPKLNGIDFLDKLRKIQGGQRTYVIACSARSDEETVVKMTDMGVNDYILKPFEPETLIKKIKLSGVLG